MYGDRLPHLSYSSIFKLSFVILNLYLFWNLFSCISVFFTASVESGMEQEAPASEETVIIETTKSTEHDKQQETLPTNDEKEEEASIPSGDISPRKIPTPVPPPNPGAISFSIQSSSAIQSPVAKIETQNTDVPSPVPPVVKNEPKPVPEPVPPPVSRVPEPVPPVKIFPKPMDQLGLGNIKIPVDVPASKQEKTPKEVGSI